MGTPDKKTHIAVILAVYRPDFARLERLLDSLAAQEGVKANVYTVIDGTDGETGLATAFLTARTDGAVAVAGERLGVRNAFAKGLAMALTAGDHAYFAFADQDDVWHPGKLALSVAALETSACDLVHCDARVVGEDGIIVSASLHRYERREEPSSLLDALLLNAVSGMTAVFSRAVAERALAMMTGLEAPVLHDHVVAVAAAAGKGIRHLDMALVDYVQHGGNYLGAIARDGGIKSRFAWAKRIGGYRADSLAIFQCRRELVRTLGGAIPSDIADMFLLNPRPRRLRLTALYLAAAARFLLRGQPRHWHVSVRLLDAAWRFRRR